MNGKKILHLGAGKLMINNISLLKNAGYKVFLADKNSEAPAFKFADGFKAVDIADKEGILKFAKEIEADAIIAVSDAGVYSAAYASEKLGLIYCSSDVAEKSTDKGLMRTAWKKELLSQPDFFIAENETEIHKAIEKTGLPCVLKPCLNWGSRGVSVISKEEDIPWSVNFAMENNRNNRFIIEEFINGTEVTVEGLVNKGKVWILAVSDKQHQEHPRYKVAMSLNYPGKLAHTTKAKLHLLINNAVSALQINNAAFHAECIIRNEEIFLVEMAARPGGGHIFGYIAEAVSGIAMPVALARILLNENVNLNPIHEYGACYRFFNAPKGTFLEIKNLEESKLMKGILDMGFDLPAGTQVGDISGDAGRPGFIVAKGTNREEAMENADRALANIKFIMQ